MILKEKEIDDLINLVYDQVIDAWFTKELQTPELIHEIKTNARKEINDFIKTLNLNS